MNWQYSVKQTQRLQNRVGISDKPFNTLAVDVNRSAKRTIFCSARKKNLLRKACKSVTAQIIVLQLQKESVNAYEPRQHANFDVYYIHEVEITAQSFDVLVNDNQFVWVDMLDNQIWFQIGGDKATKGGFSESIILIRPVNSNTDSMISLYIPGSATESGSNIMKCHQNMNYDKRKVWQSLSKRSAMVSNVFYHVDETGVLDSRIVKSCHVLIHPEKQAVINGHVDVNVHNILQPNYHTVDLDEKQFDKEWQLAKSKKKQSNGGWQVALEQIKQFDAKYRRPSNLQCMSESERHGVFDQQSMFVYHYNCDKVTCE